MTLWLAAPKGGRSRLEVASVAMPVLTCTHVPSRAQPLRLQGHASAPSSRIVSIINPGCPRKQKRARAEREAIEKGTAISACVLDTATWRRGMQHTDITPSSNPMQAHPCLAVHSSDVPRAGANPLRGKTPPVLINDSIPASIRLFWKSTPKLPRIPVNPCSHYQSALWILPATRDSCWEAGEPIVW